MPAPLAARPVNVAPPARAPAAKAAPAPAAAAPAPAAAPTWSGWLRKQSGAGKSGTRRKSVGTLLRKWDRRFFVIRAAGAEGARIEWFRSDDTAGAAPQHSFALGGGSLSGSLSSQLVLQLPPTERENEAHRITLQAEEAAGFAAFVAALDAAGVAVHSGQGSDAAAPRGEKRAHEVSRPAAEPAAAAGPPVDSAQFCLAVASSIRRLQGPPTAASNHAELRSALARLMAAADGAGVSVRRRQVTVTADAARAKLGIRLEPCPSAPSEIVQVKDVVDGGCAASQGVEVGMELSDVNGVAVKGWGIESIEETLR